MGTTHEFYGAVPQVGLRLVSNRSVRDFRDNAADASEGLSPELVRCLRNCADELKIQFGDQLSEQKLVQKAGRLLASYLLPAKRMRGRPRSAKIDAALQLCEQGVPWQQIPWKVLPGLANMSHTEQINAKDGLRRAVHMRQRRCAVTNQKHVS
jgi:hypothetical protein